VTAQLAQLPAQPPRELIELDEAQEGRAVVLFMAMETQWRIAFGQRTGLDYAVVDAVARWHEIVMDGQLLVWLRELEAEALRIWARLAKQKRPIVDG
jgi:hypothetical protein